MGQKVHPKGFRLKITENWDSRWFARREYADLLHEDIKIRNFLKKRLYHAGVSKIDIERAANKAKINIHTARPGHRDRQEGRGDREAEGRSWRKLTPQGDLHQHPRGAPARRRRAARGRERRPAARAPRGLPPRHEGGARARHADGRAGRAHPVGRPPGRFGDRAHGVVSRGPRAAAHAARRRELRLRRGASTTHGIIGVRVWIFRGEVLSRQEEEQRVPATGA